MGMSNSRASAADVEDLRIALGYDSWNLLGVSYGTRLALTIMRDYPDHIRSVILDSTYPLEVDLLSAQSANFDRALRVLFADCAANAVCSTDNPDLEDNFYDTLNRLNGNPATIDPEDLFSFVDEPLVVSGDLFAQTIYTSLYFTDVIPSLPNIITAAYDRDYSGIGFLFSQLQGPTGSLSIGMYLSVQCSEEAPFTSKEKVHAEEQKYDIRGAFRGLAEDLLDACLELQLPSPSPIENESVTSDIPTLILSGDYDPITPPHWGQQVADTLPNSYFYVMPDGGHGVVTTSDCAAAVAAEFLKDPTSAPDRACLDTLTAPDFSDTLF
jgi:pimeloyl-ACP methyl ester carboxylesterase